jgi:hypothetical protein
MSRWVLDRGSGERSSGPYYRLEIVGWVPIGEQEATMIHLEPRLSSAVVVFLGSQKSTT